MKKVGRIKSYMHHASSISVKQKYLLKNNVLILTEISLEHCDLI